MNGLLGIFLVCIAVSADELDTYTFPQYLAEYNKRYEGAEYRERMLIFSRRLADIRRHNADPSKTWKSGVNEYTDWTPAEFSRLLGRKRMGTQFLKTQPTPWTGTLRVQQLPTSVDWRTKGAVTPVKNQAACGSCWAFGAVETIESQWQIATGKLEVLSEQDALDCTPNPKHCGGTGGCGGGIPEIIYDSVKQKGGIASEKSYPYQSGGGRDYPCRFDPAKTPAVANVTGYVKLPENQYEPLMTAIATKGPIAINVPANGGWQSYRSGVFDGCDQANPDINHVVQLVGYGTDPANGKYWLVRNSWGPGWGEQGYIRIKMTDNEQTRCGVDQRPSDGTGCDGGPKTVTACGTCTVLYDTSYPTVA